MTEEFFRQVGTKLDEFNGLRRQKSKLEMRLIGLRRMVKEITEGAISENPRTQTIIAANITIDLVPAWPMSDAEREKSTQKIELKDFGAAVGDFGEFLIPKVEARIAAIQAEMDAFTLPTEEATPEA